jgi:phospholipid/cholesterol/gamma-HCH transport system substrate-binding protein
MKVTFNKYERVAGLFVLMAVVGSVVATIGVAVKKGFFESRTGYETVLATADGVREGTQVQMAGLRAGSVKSVELKGNNEVHVKFEVSNQFKMRIREDSVVRVVRPFIIGEKVLEITVGAEEAKVIAENAVLKSEAGADIMDLVSGRTLGPHLETMGKMMENLKAVAEALLDPERSKSIIQIFDDIHPLIKNVSVLTTEVNSMLKSVNGKKQIPHMLDNLVAVTDEVAKMLPQIKKESPQLAADLTKIIRNVAVLTDQVTAMGPELPRTSKRAIEALDETVVTLKALQKSFLLRSNVKEVRTEEAERERQPANEKAK